MPIYDALGRRRAMEEKFRSYDTEQRAMIDWLKGRNPEVRHAIALHLNFDFAEDVFEWILTQPDCDLATAASYFWRTEPLDLLENVVGRREDNSVVQRLVDRVNTGFYSRSEIYFGGIEIRNGEEVDDWVLQEAELLREFALSHRNDNLPWTLPEALVPPFGRHVHFVSAEEDPRTSEELQRLLSGLGTLLGRPVVDQEFDPSLHNAPRPPQKTELKKTPPGWTESPVIPLFLYICFLVVGWGSIYVFNLPGLAFSLMILGCIFFGQAAYRDVRRRLRQRDT